MLFPGLLSVTFRQLSAREIVDLVVKADLKAIEWGGDVHVPHGDISRAIEVRQITEDAGLTLTAYGSYYRLGSEKTPKFEDVLATAKTLGVPTIRVWAGAQGSETADEAYRQAVVEETCKIADLAAAEDITISYEYHQGTLTDTDESAQQLLKAVDHPTVRTFWQPPHTPPYESNLAGLKAIIPWLTTVHIFQWSQGGAVRHPLAEGEKVWMGYLEEATHDEKDHPVMMEFVKDDSPENFLRDAQTLKTWLEAINAKGTA